MTAFRERYADGRFQKHGSNLEMLFVLIVQYELYNNFFSPVAAITNLTLFECI